jgi:hypothetical protein
MKGKRRGRDKERTSRRRIRTEERMTLRITFINNIKQVRRH